ncbi:permease [Neobacillus sp. OS1-32]|uniref:Permease n=1 Tax=Neobacillus paridis TaxID=2803862 RepID=A0ABS1TK37_9BACI|nr:MULTISPECIES: permease [Neobacillus]MBL4950878.1 permease [Neobacillus paridis]WML31138.1 permease [Neobacillus sp. OS1-32]
MAQANSSLTAAQPKTKKTVVYAIIFLLITIAGLSYVKWYPYLNKAILAANTHSIGTSILGDKADLPAVSWGSAWSYAVAYFTAVWKAAVFGILIGSLVQVLLPTNWLLKVLGKTSFGSTAAAGFASLPGMMCTCCAAPIAVGLRKKKASVGASLAFWIGNPTLNPATLIFMTFVLSWKFTALRLVFGVLLTFGISYLANRFAPKVDSIEIEKMIENSEQQDHRSFAARWMKSIGDMILYIVPTYFLSVLVMGAVRVWLFPHISAASANSLLAVIGFAIAGMLFVIPTAAEIPIIQTFMSFGLGGGPAGALLLALPSVSLPSLLLVAKSFPKKVLFFVAGGVIVLSIFSGVAGLFFL